MAAEAKFDMDTPPALVLKLYSVKSLKSAIDFFDLQSLISTKMDVKMASIRVLCCPLHADGVNSTSDVFVEIICFGGADRHKDRMMPMMTEIKEMFAAHRYSASVSLQCWDKAAWYTM